MSPEHLGRLARKRLNLYAHLLSLAGGLNLFVISLDRRHHAQVNKLQIEKNGEKNRATLLFVYQHRCGCYCTNSIYCYQMSSPKLGHRSASPAFDNDKHLGTDVKPNQQRLPLKPTIEEIIREICEKFHVSFCDTCPSSSSPHRLAKPREQRRRTIIERSRCCKILSCSSSATVISHRTSIG